ncbi:MAG: response regulator transcription factor [Acidimicrobiales bacterium]
MSVMQAPTRPVRVAVANDFDLVVAGVAALLAQFSPGLEVTELVVGREAVVEPVDVVLFDTYGRAEMGLDRVRDLRGMANVGRVAVYTLSWDAELVRAALGHGADAVLSKTLPARQLAADLTRVAGGESIVDPGSGRARRGSARLWPGRDHDLTERESEVLSLVAAGLSSVEVGRHLHLGVNTVKTHLRNAYRKVGVKNRAQAAAYVLQHRA